MVAIGPLRATPSLTTLAVRVRPTKIGAWNGWQQRHCHWNALGYVLPRSSECLGLPQLIALRMATSECAAVSRRECRDLLPADVNSQQANGF